MLVSTRGRYALRVMIDLAENQKDGYIPMKTVAERQDISLKYLERPSPPCICLKSPKNAPYTEITSSGRNPSSSITATGQSAPIPRKES